MYREPTHQAEKNLYFQRYKEKLTKCAANPAGVPGTNLLADVRSRSMARAPFRSSPDQHQAAFQGIIDLKTIRCHYPAKRGVCQLIPGNTYRRYAPPFPPEKHRRQVSDGRKHSLITSYCCLASHEPIHVSKKQKFSSTRHEKCNLFNKSRQTADFPLP